MGTVVEYNGVTMSNVMTRDWSETVEYDQSGTDTIGSKYRMRFEGILHFQPSRSQVATSPSYVQISGSSADSAASAVDEIYKRLSSPRGTLAVYLDGQSTSERAFFCVPASSSLAAGGSQDHADVDNGPKPQGVSVVRVVNTEVIHIQFEIVCMKIRCSGKPGGTTNLVVNNRWSIEETVDRNHYVQRSIRGRIRFSKSTTPAHAYKSLVVPPLEEGFRRETIQYNTLPNGLEADYTVVDQQIHTAAPWPATTMDITETRATGNGVMWISDIAVRLSAPPDIPKVALMVRAFQIADSRIRLVKKIASQGNTSEDAAILKSAMFIDHIGDANTAEFRCTIQETPASLAHFFDSIRTKDLGAPLKQSWPTSGAAAYQPSVSLAPRLYGSVPHKGTRDPIVLFLMHCYLQSPCNTKHEIFGATQSSVSSPQQKQKEAKSKTSFSGTTTEKLSEYKSGQFSDDHRKAPYVMARMESTYRTRHIRAHCPIAKRLEERTSNKSPTARTLTLALPLAYRHIVMDMERLNERPQIVKPEDVYSDTYSEGITGTLLDHEVTALPPTPTADGRNLLFRVRAEYRYALDRPPVQDEQVAIGYLPFLKSTGKDGNFDGKKSYTLRPQD